MLRKVEKTSSLCHTVSCRGKAEAELPGEVTEGGEVDKHPQRGTSREQ